MNKEWIKTADEIDRLRHSSEQLARILDTLIKTLRPGMSTGDIDEMSEKLMLEIGAIPIFKGYGGESGHPFPATLCTSLNEEVVHGIPSKQRIIKEGDLVKLDIGMRYEGMVSDMARTIKIGTVSPLAEKLTRITEECLDKGIKTLRPGAHIFDYARAVQEHAESNGFSVVRDLVGHGVGRELHEDPQVPNYIARDINNFVLVEGMTLALEPMVNAGTHEVEIADDDWAFITADDALSAHFENTVVITKNGAEILTKLPLSR